MHHVRRGRRRARRTRTSRPTVRGRAEDEARGVDRPWRDTLVRACARRRTDIPPLRGAVLGLGMIGRHHARLLQASPRVDFAGAVDPAATASAPSRDPALRLRARSTSCSPPGRVGLRDRRACPPRSTCPPCASSPRAGVARAGREAARGHRRRGAASSSPPSRPPACHGAVGHVERFNPALLELRRARRGRPARRGLPDRHRAHRPVPRPRARRRRRQGPRHPRPRPRPLARRRARRSASPRRPSTGWAASTRTSSWSPARCANGVAVQLRRRLADADEGPPHARARRARACSSPTRSPPT